MTDLFADWEKCTLHKQFELKIKKTSFEIRIGVFHVKPSLHLERGKTFIKNKNSSDSALTSSRNYLEGDS